MDITTLMINVIKNRQVNAKQHDHVIVYEREYVHTIPVCQGVGCSVCGRGCSFAPIGC